MGLTLIKFEKKSKIWITVTRVTVKIYKILARIRAQRIKLTLDTSFCWKKNFENFEKKIFFGGGKLKEPRIINC
jgi:hypothetical protein